MYVIKRGASPENERKKKMKKLNTEQYIDFIKNTIATEGYKVADIANKIALEKGAITTEQYSKAASLIVAALLG
jgi:predicted RNA-binding protein associated with RNAse of E/G family